MSARILAIEDNAANLELAHSLFASCGYTVIAARSMGEALPLARRSVPEQYGFLYALLSRTSY